MAWAGWFESHFVGNFGIQMFSLRGPYRVNMTCAESDWLFYINGLQRANIYKP